MALRAMLNKWHSQVIQEETSLVTLFASMVRKAVPKWGSTPDERGKRDNLGLIFCITPSKHMLRPIIRTVLTRQF